MCINNETRIATTNSNIGKPIDSSIFLISFIERYLNINWVNGKYIENMTSRLEDFFRPLIPVWESLENQLFHGWDTTLNTLLRNIIQITLYRISAMKFTNNEKLREPSALASLKTNILLEIIPTYPAIINPIIMVNSVWAYSMDG